MNKSALADYTYYVRKHNPTVIYDSVATNPERLKKIRNFNCMARDIAAESIPQWLFVTPNLVNDAHDTPVEYGAQWLQSWLIPLLNDPIVNNDRTLVVMTYDEDGTDGAPDNNKISTILLGGAIPEHLRGTTDSTVYTHYSHMSSVQANFATDCLGRGDTDP